VNIVPTDAAPNQGGFAVDVNAVLGLPGPIIDTCFLSCYSWPVLVVLQQEVIVCDTQEMGGLGGELWEAVLFGDVCAGYAAILTWKRTAYVMKYEPADES
jgi:hypothetical protein